MPPFPGPVRQIGYVVEDFDRWVASWLAAGVGPFYVMRGLTQRVLYRGRPCRVTLSLGLANTGDMQVEVIQQEDSAPSVYSEFLASGREGFHQLAWWGTDFDSALRNAEAAGWPVVWLGGQAEGVRYAYVEPSGGAATIYEIMELTDISSAFNKLIRDAAEGWDGTDPIRTVG
ncbi:VOC family protein [Mycobacterium sp.]|uniref:VOC family protein n=1 Tax=Mycobacterium sp. TaxID=1785 RepID=UPI002C5DEE6B|nr:VOC family protein [Mycobacterium sp.]HME49157.1 VOC family protein [Mycobacterium sp.]